MDLIIEVLAEILIECVVHGSMSRRINKGIRVLCIVLFILLIFFYFMLVGGVLLLALKFFNEASYVEGTSMAIVSAILLFGLYDYIKKLIAELRKRRNLLENNNIENESNLFQSNRRN